MNAIASTAASFNSSESHSGRKAPASTGKVIPLPSEPQTNQGANQERTKLEPRREIHYRGERWILVKRGQGDLAKWYLRKTLKRIRARPFHECLFESELSRATVAAKIKIDAILDGNWKVHRATLQRGGRDDDLSTVNHFLARYKQLESQLGIRAETHRRNVNLLKMICRQAHGESYGPAPLSIISGKLARAWIGQRMAVADAEVTERGRASKLRTLKSEFSQVRAMFAPWILAMMRDAGLRLPDFAEFVGALKERKLKVEACYYPPAADMIERTLRAWIKLEDRNMFLAAGLALACGLRKNEISQVTAAMLTRDDHGPVLRFEGRAKARARGGNFSVRPIDPFWRIMLRRARQQGWFKPGEGAQRVLIGSETEMADGAFNKVSAWLRGLGWDTQKTNHALRAYAGSLVIWRQQSIYAGSSWLRHESVTTTERHYRYFLKEITDNFRLVLPGVRGRFAR